MPIDFAHGASITMTVVRLESVSAAAVGAKAPGEGYRRATVPWGAERTEFSNGAQAGKGRRRLADEGARRGRCCAVERDGDSEAD